MPEDSVGVVVKLLAQLLEYVLYGAVLFSFLLPNSCVSSRSWKRMGLAKG